LVNEVREKLESLQASSVAEFEEEALIILSDQLGVDLHLFRLDGPSREVLMRQDGKPDMLSIVKLTNPDGTGLYAHPLSFAGATLKTSN
jgi:hypothetical protein